jgi:glycosyltransferase involved in cell wall biosynthesis
MSPDTNAPQVDLSVVLPFRNRRAQIGGRCAEILAVLGPRDELIAVDDGSIDGGAATLDGLAASDARLRVVRLRRPFGLSAGLAAGFDRAHGRAVATLDAEGQTDPADIARLAAALDTGADMACGRRDQPRSLVPRIGNALIAAATGVQLSDFGCPLKLYRAEILREMRLYGDLYRFAPALAAWHGAQVVEVEVTERAGHAGRGGAGLRQALGVLIDLVTVHFLLSYQARPMQAIGRAGGILALVSVAIAIYLAYLKLALGQNIGGRPLTVLAVLTALLATQLIATGLLAELAVRVYFESQHKPIYAVREEIGAAADPEDLR